MNHAKVRAHATRYLDASALAWLVLFLATIALKIAGVTTNPWPIVLAPLWLPPVVLVAWKLARFAVRVVITILLS